VGKGSYFSRPDSLITSQVGINWATAYPVYGYPLVPSLVVGLNDTIQFVVTFVNNSNDPYPIDSEAAEGWWGPQVFALDSSIQLNEPTVDSTDLSYRVRNWTYRWKVTDRPDTIPALNSRYRMVIDVWDLPEGNWRLELIANDSVPADFGALSSGARYEYYQPDDLRDSVNAWEACYWRMWDDGDTAGRKAWIDTMLFYHPKCIPAWRMRSAYYRDQGDSLEEVTSYDKALQYLNNGEDHAAPDSTQGELSWPEKRWLSETRDVMTQMRRRLITGSGFLFD
jgi:hypothetical protein